MGNWSNVWEVIDKHGYWLGRFVAMASSCEILMEVTSRKAAENLVARAATETWRIEKKYSRYLEDSIVSKINRSGGQAIEVDVETASLLDYAGQLFELSDGRFDITSGVLRRVWQFDGSDRVPEESQVEAVRQLVGWQYVKWANPVIHLPDKMEIDFGGIGKEYAVDRTAGIMAAGTDASFLINFGGDIFARGKRKNGSGWMVGIDDPDATGTRSRGLLEIEQGGLATSGDARRYLLKEGVRYSHILDPSTGWPVVDAPRAITVAAGSCMEAGMLATMAMLQGAHARDFLEDQKVSHWEID